MTFSVQSSSLFLDMHLSFSQSLDHLFSAQKMTEKAILFYSEAFKGQKVILFSGHICNIPKKVGRFIEIHRSGNFVKPYRIKGIFLLRNLKKGQARSDLVWTLLKETFEIDLVGFSFLWGIRISMKWNMQEMENHTSFKVKRKWNGFCFFNVVQCTWSLR